MLVSLFYLHDHPLLDVLQLLIRKKELLTHLLHGPQPRRLLRVLRLRLGRLEEEPLGSPDQLRAVQANHHPVLQQAVRDVGGGGSGVGGAWLQQGEGVCSTTTHIGHLQHFDLLSFKITLDDSRSNLGFVFFPGKLFYGPTGFWFRRPVVVLTRTPKVRLVPRPSFHSSLTPCCHREKNIYASDFRQKHCIYICCFYRASN